MSLAAEGWRLVLRQGRFAWRHPHDTHPEDVDTTGMTDSQFETCVEEVAGWNNQSAAAPEEAKGASPRTPAAK